MALELLSSDQILKSLQEIASKSDDPTFRLKVARRAMNQTIPTVVATLDGCTIEHLANPETWLAQLAGGGDYFLHATHATNRSVSFGPMQVRMSGDMRDVDPFADTKPDWRGPREIIVPTKPKQTADPYSGFTSVGGMEPQGASPRNDRPQGSGSISPAFTAPQGDPLAIERLRLEQQREALARAAATAAEERHRNELAMAKQATELSIEKLRAEFAAREASKPQGESQIDKMLMLMREEAKEREAREESNRVREREREDRRLEAERAREEKRAEREAQERRDREQERQRIEDRLAAERKAADDRFMAMMEKINAKPEVPAYVEKMLDERSNAAQEVSKMMTPMMEMAGAQMNLMMQMVHNIAEIQPGGGEQDPPLVKLVGKIVDGIQAAATAARSGPVIRPPMPPRRPAKSLAGASAQPPAPTATPSPPPPAPAPVTAPPAAATPPLNGLDPAPTPATVTPIRPTRPGVTVFQQMVAMIKAHHDPQQLAEFFFANVQDPSVAIELAKADMQVLQAFAPHLMSWLADSEENQNYVRALLEQVNIIGERQGVTERIEGSTGEEEEEEEEAEEDEEADELDDEGEEPEESEEPADAVVDTKAKEVKP